MMLRKLLLPTLVAALTLGACDDAATAPTAAVMDDDYALVMFGESGSALEGTMGPQHGPRPFDGRSGIPPLPPELALTDEQKAEILALREAFRAEHEAELEALKAIFEEARAARQAGATRLEVRAILIEGRLIAQALRPAVWELHLAIRDVLTEEQKAWILEHRPRRFPPPVGDA
jgi:Spy/CpxP family protein refolding chaperone